jgi:hypothetical protein
MKTYKVTFSDGDSLVTGFNGTFEEAVNYYIGNIFNLGSDEDHMVTGIKVEEVA